MHHVLFDLKTPPTVAAPWGLFFAARRKTMDKVIEEEMENLGKKCIALYDEEKERGG